MAWRLSILIGAGLVGSVVVVAALLPYLPGRFDPAAWPVSFAAQALGILGIGLVPFGLAWLVLDLMARRRSRGVIRTAQRVAELVALSALLVVLVIASLAAAAWSLVVGLGLLVGTTLLVLVLATALRRHGPADRWPVPLAVMCLPVAVLAAQQALVAPAVDRARLDAMDAATPLIAAIDTSHARTGRYPEGLAALHPDHVPGLMGVDRYVYSARDGAYDLSFELPIFHPIGTREVVVHHPAGTPRAFSHVIWRLQGLAAQGWYASSDAGRPGWRTFWFD